MISLVSTQRGGVTESTEFNSGTSGMARKDAMNATALYC